MKIVVIGGSGLIGTKLVNNLRPLGHEVVAASPSSGVNTISCDDASLPSSTNFLTGLVEQLLRESLRSACSRLGSFFCAVPRRCVRLERAKKIARDRGYFVNGSEEGSFVGFRWLVEATDLSHELQ